MSVLCVSVACSFVIVVPTKNDTALMKKVVDTPSKYQTERTMKNPFSSKPLDLQEDAAQAPEKKAKPPRKPRSDSIREYAKDVNKRLR